MGVGRRHGAGYVRKRRSPPARRSLTARRRLMVSLGCRRMNRSRG